ncbi:WAP four-disulfide core domain protein 13 [Tenrec ecaudatus]|uniref:WAP four-disulfide core domain protein 13 n=1 Tax=Tenrec ecaudatus TaxID=94439 RepID=UPI003F5A8AAF
MRGGPSGNSSAKYILEPPSCESAPESCDLLCTKHLNCPEGFHCCSSFCGIICSLNKESKKRNRKFKTPSPGSSPSKESFTKPL